MAGGALLLLRRRSGTVNAWNSANTPPGGSTYGTLDAYFRKIGELDRQQFDGFFVTTKALGGDHLLQMSFGTDRDGRHFYEFDLPVTGWSERYAPLIENEARARGRMPLSSDSADMGFLDVSFPDASAHEEFARWVVAEVFKLSGDTQYEITWG